MTAQLQGDVSMRKAAEYFSAGKFVRAYEEYGRAIQSYVTGPVAAPKERVALCWYTRALLILRGHIPGDPLPAIDQGEELVKDAVEWTGGARFRGLFAYLRGWACRLQDRLDAAHSSLLVAQSILEVHGHPVDQMELLRERALLAVDRREYDLAVDLATQVTSRAITPEQRIFGRMLLADVHDARGRLDAAAASLGEALNVAMKHRLEGEKKTLEQRLKRLRDEHPEAGLPKEPPRWV